MNSYWRNLLIALGVVSVIGVLIWQLIGPIEQVYNWFWGVFLGLPHPFTWYMRKSALAHPYIWILVPVLIKVVVLIIYWGLLVHRARRFDTGVHYLDHLRQWVRDNSLTVLFVPWVLDIIWWLLVAHLWNLF